MLTLGCPTINRIADPGEHVGDRIGHHLTTSLPDAGEFAPLRQLTNTDAAHPEITQVGAGRPQRWQRVYPRTLNLGLRLALTTKDFLAIQDPPSDPGGCSEWEAEGIEQRLGVLVVDAVVQMVMSIPWSTSLGRSRSRGRSAAR